MLIRAYINFNLFLDHPGKYMVFIIFDLFGAFSSLFLHLSFFKYLQDFSSSSYTCVSRNV